LAYEYAHIHKSANARYGTNDSIKLFHYLYEGVSESQYLKRKYEVFKNYLNRNTTPQQFVLVDSLRLIVRLSAHDEVHPTLYML